ncbi:hypothetical protein [Salinigranum sp. GCM10025319]|uniref:hypothetical protein n=1 Tax=Salinigranum sp. GCM10025319 TaxID=3252687 RepID=UPI0036196653
MEPARVVLENRTQSVLAPAADLGEEPVGVPSKPTRSLPVRNQFRLDADIALMQTTTGKSERD